MFKFRSFLNYKKSFRSVTRSFGSGGHGHGHGHDEPQVPVFYDKLGKFCLVTAYLWIMYRFKEDKGQLFGFYKPWLEEHDHDHHHFVDRGLDKAPTIVEEDEDDEHHEEDEEDEE